MHEQRGVWVKGPDGAFTGGVEYKMSDGQTPYCPGPPHPSYPPQIISNNAMKNNPILDGSPSKRIAGPSRLIIAERGDLGMGWNFRVSA